MEGEITIRRATADDAALLTDLGAATFVAAYEAQVAPDVLQAFVAAAFTRSGTDRELADDGSWFFIAEVDGSVAGYARIVSGPAPAEVDADRPIELSRLYALPAHIGRGVGAALMRAALDESTRRGADVVWLGVWERNERAIRFYERWGFERVGQLPFELGSEVHTDVVMARRL